MPTGQPGGGNFSVEVSSSQMASLCQVVKNQSKTQGETKLIRTRGLHLFILFLFYQQFYFLYAFLSTTSKIMTFSEGNAKTFSRLLGFRVWSQGLSLRNPKTPEFQSCRSGFISVTAVLPDTLRWDHQEVFMLWKADLVLHRPREMSVGCVLDDTQVAIGAEPGVLSLVCFHLCLFGEGQHLRGKGYNYFYGALTPF